MFSLGRELSRTPSSHKHRVSCGVRASSEVPYHFLWGLSVHMQACCGQGYRTSVILPKPPGEAWGHVWGRRYLLTHLPPKPSLEGYPQASLNSTGEFRVWIIVEQLLKLWT